MANGKENKGSSNRGGYRPKKKKHHKKQSWLANKGGFATMLAHVNTGIQMNAFEHGPAAAEDALDGNWKGLAGHMNSLIQNAKIQLKEIIKPYALVGVLKLVKRAAPKPIKRMIPADLL